MLPFALYLDAGPDVLGFVEANIDTADIKASGVYAALLAVNEPVTPHLDTPESHPNNSPTFCVACCITIPPSPVVFEPEAIKINLSDTSKLVVFWKDAVPCTVKLLVTTKLFDIVTLPPAEVTVKSPVDVVIVLSVETPTVTLPAVTPANDGLSVVCSPKSTIDCATPFNVNLASPCAGDDNTEEDIIPAGIPVIPEYVICDDPDTIPAGTPINPEYGAVAANEANEAVVAKEDVTVNVLVVALKVKAAESTNGALLPVVPSVNTTKKGPVPVVVSVTAILLAFVAVIALFAQDDVPNSEPVREVAVIEVIPVKVVVAAAPNVRVWLPKATELFAKLVLGIADKPNVKVSFPTEAEIVNPCPDEEAKFKTPDVVSDSRFNPLNEAVANPLVVVAAVKYPASLFNCDTLLPDTTTFFQFAILYYFF